MKDRILSIVGVTVCIVLLVLPFTISGDAAPAYQGDYVAFLDGYQNPVNVSSYNSFRNEIDSYQYNVYFFANWTSVRYGSENAALIGIGSNKEIKFLYMNGGIGIAIPEDTESVCIISTANYTNGHYVGYSLNRSFQFQPYVEDDNLGYGYFRSTASSGTSQYTFFNDSGIGSQKFFYGDPPGSASGNFQYSSGWMYVDGTGASLYDKFSDQEPHKEIITVEGGINLNPENWYAYQYDTDSEGNYIPGSGNINFDFGAGDKAANFLQRGFFGEIRTWIREGNEGVELEPVTLFDFDTTLQGKEFHSPGITIDPNDRSSLLSLLAFILIPVYMFEVLCNLWGIAFRTLTGVDLISIKSDPTDSIPVPDDDDSLWLM